VYYAASKGIGGGLINEWAYMAQCSNVKIALLADIGCVLVKCEAIVKGDSDDFDVF
jgi:hypothetical protein